MSDDNDIVRRRGGHHLRRGVSYALDLQSLAGALRMLIGAPHARRDYCSSGRRKQRTSTLHY